MQSIAQKAHLYFAFLYLPADVRKYFYTTNIVESFNSILEKISLKSGGFFQSEKTLSVNVFLTLQKLNHAKWKKSSPHIIANLFLLRQLFAIRYEKLPIQS